MAFGKAFAAARKAGKKEFSYGGKSYHTRLASETPAKGPTPSSAPRVGSTPKKAPTPTPAPRAKAGVSGASRSASGKVQKAPKASMSGASRSTAGKVQAKAAPKADGRSRADYKTDRRSSDGISRSGGSLFGGLVKWGDRASAKTKAPYKSSRGR